MPGPKKKTRWLRKCRRCSILYESNCKYSRFCDGCKKPRVFIMKDGTKKEIEY